LTSQFTNRVTANAEHAREIDLQHHRVDHQPQQDGDRHIDVAAVAELDPSQPVGEPGEELPEADSRHHAEKHPERQPPLERGEALRFGGGRD
jgi:hypothetical protein